MSVCHFCHKPMKWWEDLLWNIQTWCKSCEYFFTVHKRCAGNLNSSGEGVNSCHSMLKE